MLIAHWDKTLGKVYNLNVEKKDKKVIKLIDRIVKIPEKIKRCVLKYYLTKCFQLHAVAFFQWRLKYIHQKTPKHRTRLKKLI